MNKNSGGNSKGGGGGGKSKSGGGVVKVTKAKARETKAIEDNILKLRAAIFDANGRDKNVTAGLAPAFMKYEKNGLDLSIEFATQLTRDESEWAFDLVRDSMEPRYDASGYGWDDEDKERELTEKGARFLLIRDWPEDDKTKGDLVGFVHFRFTVQGEVIDKMAGEAQLYVYDIHLEDHSQRKGLGKHLMVVLELIARREKMSFISIPVMLGDDFTKTWLSKTGRGYTLDPLEVIDFDSALEGFEVYSKSLEPPKPKPVEVEEVKVEVQKVGSESAVSSAEEGEKKVESGDQNTTTNTTTNSNTNSTNSTLKTDINTVSKTDNVFSFAAAAAALTTTTNTTTDSAPGTPLRAELTENEVTIIAQLTEMFASKHGRQPSADEVTQWIDSIRTLDENDMGGENENETEGEEEEEQTTTINKATSKDSDDWVHVEK